MPVSPLTSQLIKAVFRPRRNRVGSARMVSASGPTNAICTERSGGRWGVSRAAAA